MHHEGVSELSEGGALAGADQQRRVQLFFELLDCGRERGLRQGQDLCCSSDAAQFFDVDQCLQGGQLQGSPQGEYGDQDFRFEPQKCDFTFSRTSHRVGYVNTQFDPMTATLTLRRLERSWPPQLGGRRMA